VSEEGLQETRLSARALVGKRAFVTGGAKRIGRGLALALAEAGADVAITYRESEAEALATVAELEAFGGKALALRCDLRAEASVAAAVAAAVEGLGGLDVLVNNAGAFETVPLEKISVAEWDAMYEVNTRGPFLVAKAAHPYLKAAGGRIVNIGSLGGAAYAVADHGQGLGAGDQRELRCAWDDRYGRGQSGVRGVRAQDAHAAERAS